jgi:glycosyltransferase involved in cell wall biosynthesis
MRSALEVRSHAGDVNHVTGDVHFIALALPGPRTLLTIHDCGFLRRPDTPARRMLKWLWLDGPVHHCRYVTTVSEATRQVVIRLSGCDPAKVVVIPTVIADAFVRVDRPFNRTCPRILHIGLAPNKNFERHVAAIAGLRCELHIVGRLEPHHLELLGRHGVRYKAEHNLSTTDMHRAYVEADLLLFASTLEGFGMPIVEAQSVGRPVVTSNLSSMPEVAGEAACFVDPFSIESIRAGVERVIDDEAYRASRVEAGFDNVRRFDARTVARQYEALYRRVTDRA